MQRLDRKFIFMCPEVRLGILHVVVLDVTSWYSQAVLEDQEVQRFEYHFYVSTGWFMIFTLGVHGLG